MSGLGTDIVHNGASYQQAATNVRDIGDAHIRCMSPRRLLIRSGYAEKKAEALAERPPTVSMMLYIFSSPRS